MQLTRCPVCHSRINLDAIIQDESGRELLRILTGLDLQAGAALVNYLALFRPATRDLSNDRALRLAQEAMALHSDAQILATAMHETTQAMRNKQDEGSFKPMANHRYLSSVLETVAARPAAHLPAISSQQKPVLKPVSKTAQGIDLLKNYPTPDHIPEWFTRTVCGSVAELLTMGLEGVPAFDTLPLVVDRLLTGLWPKREWSQYCQFRGAKRLHTAFITEAEAKNRWPQIKGILGQVPKI